MTQKVAMPQKMAMRPKLATHRPAQRSMLVVRAGSAAVAPPASGVIADKKAELAINGNVVEGLASLC